MFSRFLVDRLDQVAMKVNRAVACKAWGQDKSQDNSAEDAPRAAAEEDTADAAQNDTAAASGLPASSASGAGQPAEASVGQPADWPSHWASGPSHFREKRGRPRGPGAAISMLPSSKSLAVGSTHGLARSYDIDGYRDRYEALTFSR